MEFFADFKELSEQTDYRCVQEFTSDFVELANPVCGDVVQLRVRVSNNILEGMEYRHQGCWPVQGCLELLGQRLVGENVDKVMGLSFQDFLGWVESVPASKRHAFSLTHRIIQRAVLECLAKKGYTTKR